VSPPAAPPPAAPPAEGGVPGGATRESLDDVGSSLVGGVQFDRLPSHVVRERVGRARFPDPRAAVEDDGLSVIVPRARPLRERVPGLVVAADL